MMGTGLWCHQVSKTQQGPSPIAVSFTVKLAVIDRDASRLTSIDATASRHHDLATSGVSYRYKSSHRSDPLGQKNTANCMYSKLK